MKRTEPTFEAKPGTEKARARKKSVPVAEERPASVDQRPDALDEDEIVASRLGLGSRPLQRETIVRYVGAAIALVSVCLAAFVWFALAPAERVASPEATAVTASPPPASAPRPSATPHPVAPPPVAPAPGPASAAVASATAPPAPPAIVETSPAPRPSRPSSAAVAVAASPAPAPPPSVPSAAPSASSTTPEPPAADGFLNINSLPASLVLLDGKPIGSTPKVHVQVTPGAHSVVFTNSELGVMKEVSVTVGAGETKLAVAKLRD
ncbi:MAG: hypothetical protein ACLQVI_23805 [Polyangiaceae bacterium]